MEMEPLPRPFSQQKGHDVCLASTFYGNIRLVNLRPLGYLWELWRVAETTLVRPDHLIHCEEEMTNSSPTTQTRLPSFTAGQQSRDVTQQDSLKMLSKKSEGKLDVVSDSAEI
ncbi:hypothetical protein J6590_042056 [Homalodisca vitripennis]|nr:hypothetical protein J6590_042050 [Homalodisca vitripennis]KAG8336539.1 hypothetical protein J6590_042056 [Homalodisca vitripennis]